MVFHSQDFSVLLEEVYQLRQARYLVLPLVLGLMVMNWGCEALKWQYLMHNVYPVRLKLAFKAVLSGVSVSALLPNRVAEYLGRIFYIPPQYRIKSIVASIVGNLAQLLISLVIGSAAFVAYQYYPFETGTINLYILLLLVVGFNGLVIISYFNIPLLVRALPNHGFFKKASQYLRLVSTYKTNDLGKVLGLAGMRYFIFLSQFYLLLITFHIPLKIWEAGLALPLVFLAQTLIPTIALAEIGVRGVTAIHFIAFFGGSEVSILVATYSLWLVNILIPAITGALFMVLTKSPVRS